MTEAERSGAAQVKSIILFSDGTGNSSGKLFKTNVWRLYEAIDLGPSPPDRQDQVAYYDNGIGSTSFRPLRMLQGAFGIGLRRNVLELYRYACRNYRPGKGQAPGDNPEDLGDQFYGFGFSRGAFTMRLVIDLIASQGIVPFENERELLRRTKQAHRAYCRGDGGRARLTRLFRAIADAVRRPLRSWFGGDDYDPGKNYRAVIRFIGVWDTVAAYGGPVVEITRAIDTFVYPLSMPSYALNPNVQCARHALALNDERDSFHPLLWDEVLEQEHVAKHPAAEGRLQQVWFAGVHADVGGGYPDESLSFVSLLWMIEEARKQGLRVLDVVVARYLALANSYGPIHDSRAGFGSYYRYQPRKIAALVDPASPSTMSMRDPSIRDSKGKSRGLLREVNVHESVIARIATGTDKYAPFVLPAEFNIVPPGALDEAAPQATDQTPGRCVLAMPNVLRVPPTRPIHREKLGRDGEKARLAQRMEKVWDFVWWRRILYFSTVLVTLLILFLPVLARSDGSAVGEVVKLNPLANWLPNDGRDVVGSLIRIPTAFLPDFTHGWIEGVARHWPWFLALLVLLLGLSRLTAQLSIKIRDCARANWRAALDLPHPAPGSTTAVAAPPAELAPSALQKLRSSARYQRLFQSVKWHILPTLTGIFMLLVLLWVVLVVETQMRLPRLEGGQAFCEGATARESYAREGEIDFSPDQPCVRAGYVDQDGRYIVLFRVREPWSDGGVAASPQGLGARELGAAGILGAPLRRVVNANYLQPIAAIYPHSKAFFTSGVHIQPLDLQPVPGSANTYRAEFRAEFNGQLVLFANDSVHPLAGPWLGFGYDYFYRGADWRANRGSACVRIVEEGATAPLRAPPAAGGACSPAAPTVVPAPAKTEPEAAPARQGGADSPTR